MRRARVRERAERRRTTSAA